MAPTRGTLLATLGLAALLLLLALVPSAALARHRAGACASSPHARRAAHGCARRHGKAKRTAGRVVRSKHSARRRSAVGHRSPAQAPALCEDGSLPAPLGSEHVCADGSQAACVDGATPTDLTGSTQLVCPSSGAGSEATCTTEACASEIEEASGAEAARCEACEASGAEDGAL